MVPKAQDVAAARYRPSSFSPTLNRALAKDTKVKPGSTAVQASFYRCCRSHFHAESGGARLRNLKDHFVDLIMVADMDLGLQQTFCRKVFSKLTKLKWTAPNELLIEPLGNT